MFKAAFCKEVKGICQRTQHIVPIITDHANQILDPSFFLNEQFINKEVIKLIEHFISKKSGIGNLLKEFEVE